MKSRLVALLAVSGIFAAGCVRLGVWQLERHGERAHQVAADRARLAEQPLAWSDALAMVRDTATFFAGALVELQGRYDTAHEIVLMNRIRRGAPGVNIITPLLVTGRDTAVLVNRGWVYSPDGASVDLAEWRDSVRGAMGGSGVQGVPETVIGLALPLGEGGRAGGMSILKESGAAARMSRLTHEHVSAALPYPVAPVVVQLLAADTVTHQGTPVPVPLPELTSGPHLSYALQWFAFALIAIVGSGFVVVQARRGKN